METVVITGGAMLTEGFHSNSSQYLFPILKIENVDYKESIKIKGLRYLTDATKMIFVTTDLAKNHAGIEEFISDRCGIVVATNFSSLGTNVDLEMTTLREGPRAISAMQGPNAILNATAARLGMYCNITGFNTTIASGKNASIDALEYAYEMIQKKEADIVIVGGVEAVDERYSNWLADVKIAPFGGTVILESETHALHREAKIYGHILGFSSYFNGSYLTGDKHNHGIRNEFDELMSDLIDDSKEIKNICIADKHIIEGKQKYQANIISINNIFGEDLGGATGIAQLLHSLSFFSPGKGIIFSSDWTGNFRGLLLERTAVR